MWTPFWKKWQHLLIRKYRHAGKRRLITQNKNLSLRNLLKSLTEDSKRTLSLKTFKRTVSRRYLMRNLKRILSLRAVRSFRTLNDFSAAKFFFGFLVIVYQRWGKTFIKELWPWKAFFSRHSHLKMEAK